MKKIMLAFIALGLFTTSCTSEKFADVTESFLGERLFNATEEQKFESKIKSYKLEATIVTNKGDINLFLSPEYAPETVANFVYLSKRNFYDDMKFHNVVLNDLIQSGDSKGDTTGTAGYFIKDEITNDLNFDIEGVIAMAKSRDNGPASSQFFITLKRKEEFDGKYTVFGRLKTKNDIKVAKSIREGDVIQDVQITGRNVNDFLNNFKEQTAIWDTKYIGR